MAVVSAGRMEGQSDGGLAATCRVVRCGPRARRLDVCIGRPTSVVASRRSGCVHGLLFATAEKDGDPLSQALLAAELQAFQIQLPADQLDRLLAYHAQLLAWNERLNLTRHVDLSTFVQRDVLDSWQLAQWLEKGERVLDVGTGGGVPGILIAILRPDLRVSLCDSVGKKAAAVSDIVRELKLPVTVHASRAEPLLEHQKFDSLVFRAVGPLEKILRAVEPHWGAFKRLLMIKGPAWTEERLAARHRGLLNQLELRRLASYRPPGHYGDSVILTVFPKADS